RADASFALVTDRAITAANQVSAAEGAQLLDTLSDVYDESITSLADGIARADEQTVYLRTYRHAPTGTNLTVVQLYAGDTSVGTIYYGATLDRAGAIDDLFITGCTLFQ